jgi:hypothetical protein
MVVTSSLSWLVPPHPIYQPFRGSTDQGEHRCIDETFVNELQEVITANDQLEHAAHYPEYSRDEHDKQTVLDDDNEQLGVFWAQEVIEELA